MYQDKMGQRTGLTIIGLRMLQGAHGGRLDVRLIPFKDAHLLPPSSGGRGVVDLTMPGVADRGVET